MTRSYDSARRGRLRRFVALAVGLTGLAACLTAVQPTVASAATVTTIPVGRVPASGRYIPPHVAGDREFKGHGPDVHAQAFLELADGGTKLVARACMNARETRSDWTEADGCSPQTVLFVAPIGQCVKGVNVGSLATFHYVDTDTLIDNLPASPGTAFVYQWSLHGDAPGNDAGVVTGVIAFTKSMAVTTDTC